MVPYSLSHYFMMQFKDISPQPMTSFAHEKRQFGQLAIVIKKMQVQYMAVIKIINDNKNEISSFSVGQCRSSQGKFLFQA